MKELTPQEAFSKAAAYCSGAEYCEADIRKKLEHWGLAPGAQDEVVERLRAERYIDDSRYCRCFVRDKFRHNQWGRVKIAQALRLKRLPEAACRDAMDEIEEEAYLDTLRRLLRGKSRTLKAASDYERQAKLARFALGRGFEPDIIKRCLHVDDDFE